MKDGHVLLLTTFILNGIEKGRGHPVNNEVIFYSKMGSGLEI